MKTSHKSDELKNLKGGPQIGYLWNDTALKRAKDKNVMNKYFYFEYNRK